MWQPETNECESATDSVKMRVRILTNCKNRIKTLYKQEEELKRLRIKETKRLREVERKRDKGTESGRDEGRKAKGERDVLLKH